MTLIKVAVSLVLFYLLNGNKDYWYPLISWLVDIVVTACVAWFLARRITRDYLCKKIIPRVSPNGKAVFITGCDSGFGHMTALELNRMGFFVFAGCLNANGSGAKDLLKAAPYPDRLLILQMDVTSQKEISLAYEKVQSSLAGGANNLFALINNAGIGLGSPIEWGKTGSIELYERMVNVNTFGVIRVTKTFLPLIRKSKGRIVNVASIASRCNYINMNAYGLSKTATSRFTEGLQEELSQFGVTAIDVNPWLVKTPILNTPVIMKTIIKMYNESSNDVKQAYDKSFLEKILRTTLMMTNSRKFVLRTPEIVVDTLIDAVTSAEPDAVYRIVPSPLKYIFWVVNDFLPWEIIYAFRNFQFTFGTRYLKMDLSKYMVDVNENVKGNP